MIKILSVFSVVFSVVWSGLIKFKRRDARQRNQEFKDLEMHGSFNDRVIALQNPFYESSVQGYLSSFCPSFLVQAFCHF